MSAVHEAMAAGRWLGLPLIEQLANVGSEIERALKWQAKGNGDFCSRALQRGLELLDLTIADPKHRSRLRELARLREVLIDYFLGDNQYGSTPQSWHSYFHPYGMAVSIRKHGR